MNSLLQSILNQQGLNIEDPTKIKITIIQQPPLESVQQRLLKPFPEVILTYQGRPMNPEKVQNQWVVRVSLTRNDTGEEIQNGIEGKSVVPFQTKEGSSFMVSVFELKVLVNSRHLETKFRLKFQLMLVVGKEFYLIPQVAVLSIVFEVYSNSVTYPVSRVPQTEKRKKPENIILIIDKLEKEKQGGELNMDTLNHQPEKRQKHTHDKKSEKPDFDFNLEFQRPKLNYKSYISQDSIVGEWAFYAACLWQHPAVFFKLTGKLVCQIEPHPKSKKQIMVGHISAEYPPVKICGDYVGQMEQISTYHSTGLFGSWKVNAPTWSMLGTLSIIETIENPHIVVCLISKSSVLSGVGFALNGECDRISCHVWCDDLVLLVESDCIENTKVLFACRRESDCSNRLVTSEQPENLSLQQSKLLPNIGPKSKMSDSSSVLPPTTQLPNQLLSSQSSNQLSSILSSPSKLSTTILDKLHPTSIPDDHLNLTSPQLQEYNGDLKILPLIQPQLSSLPELDPNSESNPESESEQDLYSHEPHSSPPVELKQSNSPAWLLPQTWPHMQRNLLQPQMLYPTQPWPQQAQLQVPQTQLHQILLHTTQPPWPQQSTQPPILQPQVLQSTQPQILQSQVLQSPQPKILQSYQHVHPIWQRLVYPLPPASHPQ